MSDVKSEIFLVSRTLTSLQMENERIPRPASVRSPQLTNSTQLKKCTGNNEKVSFSGRAKSK